MDSIRLIKNGQPVLAYLYRFPQGMDRDSLNHTVEDSHKDVYYHFESSCDKWFRISHAHSMEEFCIVMECKIEDEHFWGTNVGYSIDLESALAECKKHVDRADESLSRQMTSRERFNFLCSLPPEMVEDNELLDLAKLCNASVVHYGGGREWFILFDRQIINKITLKCKILELKNRVTSAIMGGLLKSLLDSNVITAEEFKLHVFGK